MNLVIVSAGASLGFVSLSGVFCLFYFCFTVCLVFLRSKVSTQRKANAALGSFCVGPLAFAAEPSSLPVNHIQSDTAHMSPREVNCCVCLTFEPCSRRDPCANALNKTGLERVINQKNALPSPYTQDS